MTAYWNTLAGKGWVTPVVPDCKAAGVENPDRRMLVRAEIEATVARHVFGLDRAELEHVLDTFPTARNYELEEFGEFRTRRLILEAYDRLASASGDAR